MIKNRILFALFLLMVIILPKLAKGIDVVTVDNLGAIFHSAGGVFAAMSAPLSTNTPDPSTVVTLTSFTATLSNREILLEWETATEEDTIGFFIYRSEAENGAYTTQVNSGLIPSTGSVVSGGQYSFSDTSVLNGKTYYYKLTSIDANGNTTWYDDLIASAAASWPCQTDTDCAKGLICDEDTNQCISNSSSTSTTVLVSTSTTTAQFSSTTTQPTTTTTTTIRSGPCAAEALYGENSEETELLRTYRDSVLSKTPEGLEIIKTYYKFSPKVIILLQQRPLLKHKAKTVIDGMLPGIRKKVEESNKKQ